MIAAVATDDRWNHLLHCPYCSHVHSHGGHGPSSPFGAVDGGRYAHCRSSRDPAQAGVQDLQDAGILTSLYVIKEVPGSATMRTPRRGEGDYIIREVTYDCERIATMKADIDALVADYESKWEGPDQPKDGRFHPAELAFRRGEIPWPSAYKDEASEEEPWPPAAVPSEFRIVGPPCAVYLHYDADDALLYVGITDDVVSRGRSHASRSSWTQFAVRGELIWCPSREEALRKEVELIQTLRPLFNDKHAAPDRDQHLVAYLVGKGRLDLLAPAVSRG